jgi:His/Glu/Gln/Arg/opine family amino acid ABC transporter permease subunit
MSTLDILWTYKEAFIGGLTVTLQLCVWIWGLGLVIGILLAALGSGPSRLANLVVTVGAFVFSGLPTLVLLFWLHYPLQSILGVVIDPFVTTVLALGMVNIFLVAQQVSTALKEFPEQYVLAATVAGLNNSQIFRYIKFPILLRQLIPSLLTTQVNMLQLTLFASLISVEEIFRVAQRINSQIYRPVEIYTALGLFFLAVCLPLNGIALVLKNRFTRNLSES